MEKRTIIIISVISIILTLIYILFEHFGWTRYISLQIFGLEKYIDAYKNVESVKQRIILVILTNQKRINSIKPLLNSILDQTIRVNEINILLPCKKTKVDKNILKVANVFYGCSDLNTIIPKERDKNTNIIILRDDVIYGKDFVEIMVEEREKEKKIISTKDIDAILLTPEDFDEKIFNVGVIEWLKEKNNIKFIDYNEIYQTGLLKRKRQK